MQFFSLICITMWLSAVASFTVKGSSCVTNAFPPKRDPVPTYVIDLDLPPSHRYIELLRQKRDDLRILLDDIKELVAPAFHGILFEFIDEAFPFIVERMPYPFNEELHGIANATGFKLGEVALYNIFYEIFTVCTSIVAQDRAGKLYHGRNLDFGLFLGWDRKNNTWKLTESLRPLIVKLDYQRSNKTVFSSVAFAGYVGVLTAVRPKSFTLTINERFTGRPGILDLLEWIVNPNHGQFVGFLPRVVMENATDYQQAQKMLAKTHTLSPCYFIVAGLDYTQACVLTRNQTKFDIWPLGMATESQQSTWYLLQTNYDHWKKPPFFDNRRMPGVHCMDKMGPANVSLGGLYNVLSTPPVLNKLTTYTALMQVDEGYVDAWIQDCEGPSCPIW